MKTPNAHNLRSSFRIGRFKYDFFDNLDSSTEEALEQECKSYAHSHRYSNSQITVLMSPRTFLNLTPDIDNPYYEKDVIVIRDKPAIGPLYLAVYNAPRHGKPVVCSHDGRHRALTSLRLQPHLPVPVRVHFEDDIDVSLEYISKFSEGAMRQAGNDNFIKGPLFKAFFYQGERWGIFKNEIGETTFRPVPQKSAGLSISPEF